MVVPSLASPIRAERITLAPANVSVVHATGWPKDEPDGMLLAIEAAGDVAGFLVIGHREHPTIEVIWMDPTHRRAGLGVEAAFAVCDALRAAGGVREVRAWVPSEVGLLVYFWLRVGFAPIRESATELGMLVARRL